MAKSIADGFPDTVVERPFDRSKEPTDIPEYQPEGRFMRAAKNAGAITLIAVVGAGAMVGLGALADRYGSTDSHRAAQPTPELTQAQKGVDAQTPKPPQP